MTTEPSTRHEAPFDEPADAAGPTDDFIQLFTANQRPLFLFILGQIPYPVEAEEILQETNLIIWRKNSQFQSGTNFLAWANRIARFEVLKHLDRKRSNRLVFSDDLIRQIAAEQQQQIDSLGQRRDALVECLRKLRSEDRRLIQLRYAPGETGATVSAAIGRPANSVYQSIGRIRRTLLECINRRLAAEGVQ